MFYCDSPSLFCILINLLSIPIRIALSALIISFMAMILAPLLIIVGFWLVVGLVGGFTVVACELIQKAGCPLAAFMILFYPITAIVATGYAMYETR